MFSIYPPRYLMGTEFQFYKMKRVLEMGGGDGCTM